MTTHVKEAPPTTDLPMIVMNWRDNEACPDDLLEWLINLTIKRLGQNQVISVGCIGGHGRTGTFLACLIGKVEGLAPKDAILAVRQRLCQKAIESNDQYDQVYTFLGLTRQDRIQDGWQRLPLLQRAGVKTWTEYERLEREFAAWLALYSEEVPDEFLGL